MERKRLHVWSLSGMRQARALICVAVCFGTGSVLGCLFSTFLDPDSAVALRSWLDSYLTVTRSGGAKTGFLALLWPTLRLPLLLTLLQFTVLGVLLIPLAMGVRGFLLSFAVTGFVRSYAWNGLGAALVLFGVPSVIELSALFLLSVNSWLRSEALGRDSTASPSPGLFFIDLLCYAVLALSALLQSLLSGQISHALDLILK